ncbi:MULTISPECIES: YceI family protein [unclassified Streptomyces]|uniref:YceI family protein n=1 Tax=unclassified Streptomyces TaxID=2593676 RepID=UPI0033D7574F
MSSTNPVVSELSPEVSGDYLIDTTHSRIGFVARHAMVTKVRGTFNQFDGQLTLDAQEPTKSTAAVTIDVASVDTRNDYRDGHLRTNEFFDVENHPQITFRSTSVERTGESTFRMTGDLTIKGVSRQVDIDWEFAGLAKDPMGNVRAGFEGTAQINRSDFGINFNAALETGGVMVSEKIGLDFDISAVKTVPEQ